MSGKYETVVSKDGTRIAYERFGDGPPVILIGGAGNSRHFPPIAAVPMAMRLASNFTVIAYDRRGRGDSTDTLPYAVEREVDDIAALIEAVGAPVRLFGHSSGAALVLQAAIAGLPVATVAIYEPPYSLDAEAVTEGRKYAAELDHLLAAGRLEEAAVSYLAMTGMPDEMIAAFRQMPTWPAMTRMAPTLAYDIRVVAAGGGDYVPKGEIATITAPLLAMAGGRSPDWMKEVARQVAEAAPNGTYREFTGKDHMIDEADVAPVLVEFFGRMAGGAKHVA
jgi:pimeloyl-ACP methyl ester carboxylesterase